MADQESRGGQKQGEGNANREARRHVAAPTDKTQPGHQQDPHNRERAKEEINARERKSGQ